MVLFLLGVVAPNLTDVADWVLLGLLVAGFACLLFPALAVPSTVLVTTTARHVVVLDASPFRSTPRAFRAAVPVAHLDRGRWFLGGRLISVAGARLWVGSFWATHLPAR